MNTARHAERYCQVSHSKRRKGLGDATETDEDMGDDAEKRFNPGCQTREKHAQAV
jgi:hypothetical protein